MTPAVLFWAMVIAGSLHGQVAFGRDTRGWRDGWEYLVPGTLDGVSVTFAFLAFRAVRMQKSPARCQRVVWGAAIASATVNFACQEHGCHDYDLQWVGRIVEPRGGKSSTAGVSTLSTASRTAARPVGTGAPLLASSRHGPHKSTGMPTEPYRKSLPAVPKLSTLGTKSARTLTS
jgi:hypothetical protein